MKVWLNLGIKYLTVSLTLTFQSVNNGSDIASAQDALHEVFPTQDVLGESSAIGISESNTIHSEQPPEFNTYDRRKSSTTLWVSRCKHE